MPALSVLDVSPVVAGSTEADALRATIDLAEHAEVLGYKRFWLAEHHGGAMVASSSPELMIGAIAPRTSRIRVGSGGVMLPNHSPLRVAEQFKVLEALHPGRVDLGIGRAPGTDQLTAFALRRSREAMLAGEDLGGQLDELLRFAGAEPWPPKHHFERVRAAPFDAPLPPIYLLGSSEYSARLAAERGLPFAFAAHINPSLSVEALRMYRATYRPSEDHPEPCSILGHAVVCAPDEEEAWRIAAPARVAFRRLRAGEPTPLPTVEEALAEEGDRPRKPPSPTDRTIVGTPAQVRDRLEELRSLAGADELILMTNTHSYDDRVRSYELLAEEYGLEPPGGDDAGSDHANA